MGGKCLGRPARGSPDASAAALAAALVMGWALGGRDGESESAKRAFYGERVEKNVFFKNFAPGCAMRKAGLSMVRSW